MLSRITKMKKTKKISSDLLTPKELAKRWNTSVNTLANKRYFKTGPSYIKIGRKVLYKKNHIEKYEKLNEVR